MHCQSVAFWRRLLTSCEHPLLSLSFLLPLLVDITDTRGAISARGGGSAMDGSRVSDGSSWIVEGLHTVDSSRNVDMGSGAVLAALVVDADGSLNNDAVLDCSNQVLVRGTSEEDWEYRGLNLLRTEPRLWW